MNVSLPSVMGLEELANRLEQNFQKILNRRDFYTWMAKSTLISGMGILGSFGSRPKELPKEKPKDSVPLYDPDPSSPVKKFAQEIASTATRLVPRVLNLDNNIEYDGSGIGTYGGILL